MAKQDEMNDNIVERIFVMSGRTLTATVAKRSSALLPR
jgi:hypothetical protein